MEIACAPSGIVQIKNPKQGLSKLADAGFEAMLLDISLCCSPEELERMGERNLCGIMQPLLNECGKKGIQMQAAYAPYLSRNTKRTDLNEQLTALAAESIKLCGLAGSRYLVVRPLFAGIADTDLWQRNKEFYLSLATLAREYGVQILLENQCKDVNGHLVRGVCADLYEAEKWVDQLNETAGEERFGFCMDVGACSLCGQNMYDFATGLGERLKAVILRDCDGGNENALMPFTSAGQGQAKTNWLSLIRGLRQIEFGGQLIISVKDTVNSFPLFLRPEILKLAKKVVDYFKWQIEIEKILMKYPARVLFGAGNMCRNYMKCYGEQYPPLYTCDNNSSIWGTSFCGLQVKAPQSLKELPEDCAIFICNIYYEEIKAQLQGMGVKNPIEFFNDEYMPSFYFDRLEMKESWK